MVKLKLHQSGCFSALLAPMHQPTIIATIIIIIIFFIITITICQIQHLPNHHQILTITACTGDPSQQDQHHKMIMIIVIDCDDDHRHTA